ncbi:hypothetical protein [Micromonospora profundi]|uniref:hypothetical protein n=1 Tax=Micromonospora profundi TaxID=1420889 RepID=UPI0036A18FB0
MLFGDAEEQLRVREAQRCPLRGPAQQLHLDRPRGAPAAGRAVRHGWVEHQIGGVDRPVEVFAELPGELLAEDRLVGAQERPGTPEGERVGCGRVEALRHRVEQVDDLGDRPQRPHGQRLEGSLRRGGGLQEDQIRQPLDGGDGLDGQEVGHVARGDRLSGQSPGQIGGEMPAEGGGRTTQPLPPELHCPAGCPGGPMFQQQMQVGERERHGRAVVVHRFRCRRERVHRFRPAGRRVLHRLFLGSRRSSRRRGRGRRRRQGPARPRACRS